MAYLQIDKRMRGYITKHMLPMYNLFCTERPSDVVYVPSAFKEMVEICYERHGYPLRSLQTYEMESFDVEGNEHDEVVGFSGGLDSSYMALSEHDGGMSVRLFHVTGLNKAYPDEDTYSRRFSTSSEIPLTECRVKHIKNQKYVDNPLKNQLIMSMMADYGISHGITTYAMGADWCTDIRHCEIGFTITDSIEINGAFLDGMRKVMPSYNLRFIGGEVKKADRLRYIIVNHRECLNSVSSCISPHRFKKMLHTNNMRKYGVDLMDGRCGSCFKCCMEWLILRHTGYVGRNDAFEQHCWGVLSDSKNSHRKDLFDKNVPKEKRILNLMEYGS